MMQPDPEQELTWWEAAADLFLGADCAACARPALGLCRRCRDATAELPRWIEPTHRPEGFPRCLSGGEYAGATKAAILRYKEDGALTLQRQLAARLGLVLTDFLREHPGPVWLVPMPSSRAAVRRRGLDAVAALAAGGAKWCTAQAADGPRLVRSRRLLRQRHGVLDQAGLDADRRVDNLAGGLAMRWPYRSPDRPVIIADDVVTTGASLTEAARCLRAAGWEVRGAVTIAATRRRAGISV